MPIDTDTLSTPFRGLYQLLLSDCRDAGTQDGWELIPYCAQRHPREQASLWRQSRSRLEVRTGIQWLRGAGAGWLADLTEAVGPQFGPWRTNAVAGNSWHQWLEACDAFVLDHGRAAWNGDHPGYRFYAQRAAALGMRCLADIADPGHVQARKISAPSHLFTWPEIDAEMRRRYGP